MNRRTLFQCLIAMAMSAGLLATAAAQGSAPAANTPQPTPSASASPVSTPSASTSSVSAMAVTNSMSVLDDKRKLAIGDRLSFRVVEDRKQPVMMYITDSGEVEVPLIGRIRAVNKTCKELAEEIKAPLEKDYFYKATVIIGLDYSIARSAGRVYVTGNVRAAGPLEIPPDENLTVSRAILRAGGFDQFANKHKVKLIRKKAGSPSETETIILDVGDIIDKGQAQKDMVVQPDDMIIVPRAFINI